MFLWILLHGNGLTHLAMKRQLLFANLVIMHSSIVLVVYVVFEPYVLITDQAKKNV